MATKKSVKQALKYALGSDEMKCSSCREEMGNMLKDIGLAVREHAEQGFTIRVKNGHVEYKQAFETHSGPPAKKPKKEKTEGADPVDEEDEA